MQVLGLYGTYKVIYPRYYKEYAYPLPRKTILTQKVHLNPNWHEIDRADLPPYNF